MSLENFYKLRDDFTLIGLTGRMGGGCNDIAKILSSVDNPFDNMVFTENLNINEKQKFNICKDFITHKSNTWEGFTLLKYKDVLLLFFLSELVTKLNYEIDKLEFDNLQTIFQRIYNEDFVKTTRFGQENETDNFIASKLLPFLISKKAEIEIFRNVFKLRDSKINIENIDDSCNHDCVNAEQFDTLFFTDYSKFCKDFYKLMDKNNPLARQLFLQDIACNLRSNGTIFNEGVHNSENIYIVAEVIKNIIKINKRWKKKVRLIIDSLKNSLEINFFKERYSGFYLISSNRDFNEVKEYLTTKIRTTFFDDINDIGDAEQVKVDKVVNELIDLDDTHYKIGEFKKGNFTTPDLENCIQKADYYVFNKVDNLEKPKQGKFAYYNIKMQLLKLIALIQKPGIITPNAMERTMQLAFSSKYNSGCISRQVGAVVTDEFYSVKSVGWNEVPQGQTPCSLRSITDLVENKNKDVFTRYEKKEGNYDDKTFKEQVEKLITDKKPFEEFKSDLKGHNCPFCFKELHNTFEGKDNQVHTRSLHAEENAMLQISKYGGQPLIGGNLFTTASPCELCSKKAYQLGIKNIFYIDPYPGISKSQILKGGNKNPKLYMFQGAVGRGFFKLFEPYLSIKDETKVRFDLKPNSSQKSKAKQLKVLLADNLKTKENKELVHYLDGLEDDSSIIEKVISLMNGGLNKNSPT